MKKYIVIMDWTFGTLGVFKNTGNESDYGCNLNETVWNYFDELPNFDESLLLDSGRSEKYLTIFDFTQNKGIIIPITEEQHDILINDYNQLTELMLKYGLKDSSDWMITDDDKVYFTDIHQ